MSRTCPDCGEPISFNAAYCKPCGTAHGQANRKQTMAYRTDPQRKVEAIQLRKDGMLVADIADKLFPCDDAGINRVQSLLEDQPRRIACMGGTLEGRGPVQGGSHPMMLVAR